MSKFVVLIKADDWWCGRNPQRASHLATKILKRKRRKGIRDFAFDSSRVNQRCELGFILEKHLSFRG